MKSILITSTKIIIITIMSITFSAVNAQKSQHGLPYKEIGPTPENYNSGNILARFIDGLGYRYYWATEGLTEKDLNYAPSDSGRTSIQTIEHIFGLSETIVNGPTSTPNIRPAVKQVMSFEELRRQTLQNFKKASELCAGQSPKEIEDFKVIFQSPDYSNEFPFWNMINGPLSDAIYHVGQVVLMRRASGNPMNPKVNVFTGKTGK